MVPSTPSPIRSVSKISVTMTSARSAGGGAGITVERLLTSSTRGAPKPLHASTRRATAAMGGNTWCFG